MIKFIAKKRESGKITIGIVLMPGDIGGLLNGVPDVISIADFNLEKDAELGGIVVMFFRDQEEFRTAMTNAGATATSDATVKTETVMTEPGTKDKFKSPPLWKILEN